MNVSVGERWEKFVAEVVAAGRYGSASEVVREGLRMVEEREAKLKALRDEIQEALASDEWYTEAEVDRAISEVATELSARSR